MRAYEEIGGVTDSAVKEYIDSTQSDRECCGSDGFESWRTLNTTWWRNHRPQLAPESCCKTVQDGCNNVATNLYQRGCTKELESISEKAFLAVYAVGGAVALLAFIEVATACYMARTSNSGSFI